MIKDIFNTCPEWAPFGYLSVPWYWPLRVTVQAFKTYHCCCGCSKRWRGVAIAETDCFTMKRSKSEPTPARVQRLAQGGRALQKQRCVSSASFQQHERNPWFLVFGFEKMVLRTSLKENLIFQRGAVFAMLLWRACCSEIALALGGPTW